MALWVGPPLPVLAAGPAGPVDPVAPREPQRAGVGRRALGWFIDYLIVMVPGLFLIGFAVQAIVHGLPAYAGEVAAEVGVPRLIGLITSGGKIDGGIGAVVAESWVGLVRPLLLALLAVPLLQFLYHLSLLAWRGRTIGKMIADTQVVPARPEASARFAVKRAAAATLVETGPVGVGLAVVVYGELTAGALVLTVAVAVWWVNLLPVFGARHRTLVDRVSGTVVLRRALYAQVAARTAELARRTSGAAVVAGQRGTVLAVETGRRTSDAAAVAARMSADAAVVAAQVAGQAAAAARRRSAEHLPAAARRTTDAAVAAARVTATAAADAAAVAGHAARHGAGKVFQAAPVQQALNSKVGQQSQALGAAGAQRARRLGGRTAGLARTVGDRTQQLWQERQAARAGQPDQPPAEPPAGPQPALPATSADLTPASEYLPPQPEPWRHPLP
ncbi:RDD family protein [Dactylosporangium sp. NPDC049525]|uniref:RDD family protein n=1 Tax=Dactylosporangium sp. NPDC049525 TaxID=3154730 RepID=UPI0034223D8D